MDGSDLRRRLTERLSPASDWRAEAGAVRSDFDLNPDAARPARTLKQAAVLVPVVARTQGATVLLTRRADTLASHTGQIAFPGGRLDPGETAVEAALREAWEEIGLAPDQVEVLGLSDAYESGTGFLITPVVGWIAAQPDLRPSPDEVAEVFETPWSFLMNVSNHRRDSLVREGMTRWFWAMPWEERYIWGATAGMLKGLHERLYGAEASGDAACMQP